ncbi:MAG TPA: transporter substrate-binding domain-containing protein [Vicinamibacterales bacterium]
MNQSGIRPSAVSITRTVSRGVIVAAALILFAASPCVLAQLRPLDLVSTAWAPFTNPPGQPRFALDVVEEALHRVHLTANTTIVSAPDFTTALLSGRFDGSAAAWKDAERERTLVFSQPYLENRLVLIGRRGADVSAKALGDLAGRRVAIVEGYSYGDAVHLAGPEFVRSSGEEDSLTKLLSGEVDYTLMDDLVVQYILSNYPKESDAKLQIGSVPLVRRELHLAIRRTRSDAESLITRFNSQLRGMIADRTYHRLLHVDWIRADVTGDGIAENVPFNDRPGPTEPLRIYSLTSPSDATRGTSTKPGFYFGGHIYEDWASVPDSYKEPNPKYPDPRRSSGSIFKFVF